MAKIGVTKERPLIPAGEHILTLREVRETRVKSQYADPDSDGKVDKLLWRFESREMDDEGDPYEFVSFTNLNYGNAQASLTELLDQMVPGITADQAEDLDTDELIGNRYRARIKHEPDKNGVKRGRLISIEPAKKKGEKPAEKSAEKPKAKAKTDDEDDDDYGED